jgi:hypothetical protein
MQESLKSTKGMSQRERHPELTPTPEEEEQLMKELFGPGKHRVETIRIDPKTGRPENWIIMSVEQQQKRKLTPEEIQKISDSASLRFKVLKKMQASAGSQAAKSGDAMAAVHVINKPV